MNPHLFLSLRLLDFIHLLSGQGISSSSSFILFFNQTLFSLIHLFWYLFIYDMVMVYMVWFLQGWIPLSAIYLIHSIWNLPIYFFFVRLLGSSQDESEPLDYSFILLSWINHSKVIMSQNEEAIWKQAVKLPRERRLTQ